MSGCGGGGKFSQVDRQFMDLALDLAGRAGGKVKPNPAVGAVIVKSGRAIGRGYHRRFGGPHAEIVALRNCRENPRNSTVYVTLEPCCHHGKTPPCTEAIIAAGIKRVVVATRDPFAQVAGKGIAALRNAGITVDVGLLASRAVELNGAYFKFHRRGLPWVILKWAQTIDGKWAAGSGRSRWISSPQARKYAHLLRAGADAVLVGIGTVLKDNPLLTVRLARGRNPVRIVLDTQLRIATDCKLVTTAGLTPTIIVTGKKAAAGRGGKVVKLQARGCRIMQVPLRGGGIDLSRLLIELSKQGIGSILVEGGPTVAGQFLKNRLADRLAIFVAPQLAADSQAPAIDALKPAWPGQFIKLQGPEMVQLGPDWLIRAAIQYPRG